MLLLLGCVIPAAAQTLPPQPLQPQDGAVPSQPKSQPGAKGQSSQLTQPSVPVPPGPVPPKQIKPAPPTPIAVKKVELNEPSKWNPEWDVIVEENLPPDLLSPQVARAVRPYCPRFNVLSTTDKRAFWAYLFQALAGAEAGLKPTTNVRHTEPEVAVKDDVTHRMVRSEGLLQLTYMDAQRYGCAFDWDKDKNLPEHDPDRTILQPKNNLICGEKIMQNQLINLHEPLLTSKSYWSTLRPGTISFKVFARQMANVPVACTGRSAGTEIASKALLRQVSATAPAPASAPQPAAPTAVR